MLSVLPSLTTTISFFKFNPDKFTWLILFRIVRMVPSSLYTGRIIETFPFENMVSYLEEKFNNDDGDFWWHFLFPLTRISTMA